MKKLLIFLFVIYSTCTLHAEDNLQSSSSIGAVETTQHKTEDDPVNTTYLQKLQNASHSGFYGLGFLGIGYHTAKIENHGYKDHSAQYGVIIGQGCVLQNKRYVGAELVYTRDLFDKHKNTTRFRRSNIYEVVGRYGKIIEANFLPYMRLGIGYQQYQYFTDTKKTNFHGILVTPGVGVQAFVKPQVFIRAETNYQFATTIKSKGLKINRKVQGPSIWGGVGLIF